MYQQLLFNGAQGASNRRNMTAGFDGNVYFVVQICGGGGGSYFPRTVDEVYPRRWKVFYDKFQTMGGGSGSSVLTSSLALRPETIFGPLVKGSNNRQFEFDVKVGAGLPGRSIATATSSRLDITLREKITGNAIEFESINPYIPERKFPLTTRASFSDVGGGRSTRTPQGADNRFERGGHFRTSGRFNSGTGGAGSGRDGYTAQTANGKGGPGGRGEIPIDLFDRSLGFTPVNISESEKEAIAKKGAYMGGGGYGGGGLNPDYADLSFKQDAREYGGGAGNTKLVQNAVDNRGGGAKGAEIKGQDNRGGSGAVWIWQPYDARVLAYDPSSVELYFIRADTNQRIIWRGYKCTASTRLILPTAY